MKEIYLGEQQDALDWRRRINIIWDIKKRRSETFKRAETNLSKNQSEASFDLRLQNKNISTLNSIKEDEFKTEFKGITEIEKMTVIL